MIRLITLGKFKDTNMQLIANDYIKRIGKFHKLEVIELKEQVKKTDSENLFNESEEISKYLSDKAFNVCLTPNGTKIDSKSLSQLIDKTFNNHSEINFIIGSSNGIHQTILEQSNMNISFSDLTFPHLLFRVMLLEQIYRAFKIINNERYHK